MASNDSLALTPIGVIHTPFSRGAGTPVQPAFGQGVQGQVEVFSPYAEALADVTGFERIWLLFLLDRSGPWKPRVVPYRDVNERGLFATRAPSRPNPLGLSVVRLLGRQENQLLISDLDILDGTPLLDIKPYVPEFDAHPDSAAGWLDARTRDRRVADERFQDPSGKP